MNMALGGLFSSRINMNLREEHGYTYGAGSVFSYRRLPGAFYAATGVRTDVTGPAVSEIFKEITRMAETPLTSEELSLAKDSLVRSLPGAFETSGQLVGNLSNIYTYDLGLDYFSRYPERMSAVTSEMAQEAAKKYLDPSKMLVVAVGDRQAIAPQLDRLNLGRTEIRDADGRVVR
jgi:zinc protease